MKYFFIILGVTLPCAPLFASQLCKMDGQLGPMSTEHQEVVAIAHKAAEIAASQDLKQFCIWNRMGRLAQGIDGAPKVAYSKARAEGNLEKAAEAISEVYTNESGSPWQASLTGHPKLKEISRHAPLNERLPFNIDDIAAYAKTEKLMGKKVEVGFGLPEQFRSYNRRQNIDLGVTKKVAACLYVGGAMGTPGCVGNVDKVIEYAAPTRGSNTTAAPTYIKVLQDSSYEKGLKLLTSRMHQRLKEKKVDTDFFSDVKNAFVDSGDDAASAEDKAWEIMAIYGSAGPNVAGRLAGVMDAEQNGMVNPNAIYLSGIAAMIPHLDTITMESKNPRNYSLPMDVKFPCDSGKNYHFWMSAYLSRMLAKQGSSDSAAISASYIAELGYQFNARTAGRDPTVAMKCSDLETQSWEFKWI